MSFHTVVITQTVVGILGLVPAYLIGMASVLSAANAQNHRTLASFVIGVGVALPLVLVISLIGMWIAHHYAYDRTALVFLVVPWAHLLLLILATLGLFRP